MNRISLISKEARIVLFAADWCGYCRRFLSVINEYESRLETPIPSSDEIVVVNVESGDGSLWEDFRISLVPTIAVFSNGREIFRRDGKPFVGLERKDLEDAIRAVASKKN